MLMKSIILHLLQGQEEWPTPAVAANLQPESRRIAVPGLLREKVV
jgi:hypothetical protein